MDYKYIADEIVNSISMADLLAFYGFQVNRAGFINCPFHSEKTASFRAFPENKGFYCFGCGEGGSVIDFVKKYFNLDFIDAVKKINEDFNLNLPINSKPTLRQKRQINRRQTELEKKQIEHEKILQEYQLALNEYVRLDNQFIKYKPNADSEPLNPLFIEALQKKEYASYKLDEAEERLREYESR